MHWDFQLLHNFCLIVIDEEDHASAGLGHCLSHANRMSCTARLGDWPSAGLHSFLDGVHQVRSARSHAQFGDQRLRRGGRCKNAMTADTASVTASSPAFVLLSAFFWSAR